MLRVVEDVDAVVVDGAAEEDEGAEEVLVEVDSVEGSRDLGVVWVVVDDESALLK